MAKLMVPIHIKEHVGAGAYMRLRRAAVRLLPSRVQDPRPDQNKWLTGAVTIDDGEHLLVSFQERKSSLPESLNVGGSSVTWLCETSGNQEYGKGLRLYLPKDIWCFLARFEEGIHYGVYYDEVEDPPEILLIPFSASEPLDAADTNDSN